jgi:nonspecific dipeptidase
VLTEKDGKLYGRGSTDDKGPVICWLNAIEAFKALKIDMPINLKVVTLHFSCSPAEVYD